MDKLFQVITDNLPSHYNNAHHNLTLIKTTTAYTAPELMGNIWIKLWNWVQTYIIPYDTEPWTIPIRESWQECMQIVNSKKEQP
tara:strand:- start:49 stop:300 length:252 start_codon:yes stop_codon:yes gene_type:complete